MKKQEIQQLKNKSVGELQSNLKDSRFRLRTLLLDLQAGKVKDVREIRDTKKNIARVLTFLKQHASNK
jgi:ribosomal protein L29